MRTIWCKGKPVLKSTISYSHENQLANGLLIIAIVIPGLGCIGIMCGRQRRRLRSHLTLDQEVYIPNKGGDVDIRVSTQRSA